jgi:hypothetical protein
MTKTDENKLAKEFTQKIAGVLTSTIEDKDTKVNELKKEYEQRLTEIRERDGKPNIMVKKLELHITSLFHMLVLWMQYTDVIYAQEDVIQRLKFSRLNQGDDDSRKKDHVEYLNRITKSKRTDDESKERLCLFIDKQYQTVEEDITTDTGESADEEIKVEAKVSSDEETFSINPDDGTLLISFSI